MAYQKLNEITQMNVFQPQYHTLIQLHCMMNDLYGDAIDIRELYEIISTSGFQCVHHPQHGMIVLYNVSPPLPPSLPPYTHPTSLFNN